MALNLNYRGQAQRRLLTLGYVARASVRSTVAKLDAAYLTSRQ